MPLIYTVVLMMMIVLFAVHLKYRRWVLRRRRKVYSKLTQ